MRKFTLFLNIVFSFLMLLDFSFSGIHKFIDSSDTSKKAYLYIDNAKSYISTCKDISSHNSCIYLVSNPNDLALEKKRHDANYKPDFPDFDFYLMCKECAEKYLLDTISESLSPRNISDKTFCLNVFHNFSELHAITCSHDCESCGKVFELNSHWMTPFRQIDFDSGGGKECNKHSIEKFSIYRGFKNKERKNFYTFYSVFVERFPKANKVKTAIVEFPVE